MVDPGTEATIGGMVACGASGTTTVKYGPIRSNILSVEVVLPPPSGIIVTSTGSTTLKSSAGYDLTSLICGSEGTLGVITNVTVRLHPIPENIVAARCEFNSVGEAAGAVAVIRASRIDLERCELLDGTSLDAFNKYYNGGSKKVNRAMEEEMKAKPTLFFEFAGPTPTAVREHVTLTESICTSPDFNGSKFTLAQDETERMELWSARHKLYHASLSLRPGAAGAVVTDACVPLSKLAEVMEATARDVEEAGVIGPCFGHAGDGNFHCIMPLLEEHGEEEENYKARVDWVNEELMRRTLKVGGTCTGEHGVGYGKLKYLEKERESGVEMMKILKRGLDPFNIMNPGKVLML